MSEHFNDVFETIDFQHFLNTADQNVDSINLQQIIDSVSDLIEPPNTINNSYETVRMA